MSDWRSMAWTGRAGSSGSMSDRFRGRDGREVEVTVTVNMSMKEAQKAAYKIWKKDK